MVSEIKKLINNKKIFNSTICCLLFLVIGCKTGEVKQTAIGLAWSNNSVSTVKFRKNALSTFKNHQFVTYYKANDFLVLGKRKINSKNEKQ